MDEQTVRFLAYNSKIFGEIFSQGFAVGFITAAGIFCAAFFLF